MNKVKGKILTIIGIVLIFGYFIVDSVKPYDPTQVVMVGNDTLGRDWGAMAAELERQEAGINTDQQQEQTGGEQLNPYYNPYAGVVPADQDPFSRPKLNQSNYATIESPDGREIVTGYSRPEETANNPDYNNSRILTRHQIEVGQPQLRSQASTPEYNDSRTITTPRPQLETREPQMRYRD